MILFISDGVLCDKSRTPIENYLNATWIRIQPRLPVPEWPDPFISDFYVYVEIYGKGFRVMALYSTIVRKKLAKILIHA